ncbi:hypothetical protein TTHERM_00705180 (macronuclear) [Tetrahymena thermophila SB210]|uniref:Transmembrane protein n=1 Tax=Tetrahymena thermophila (strain SB210) TaxID=312017 RepID=I7LU68_TETTS|nr:hypothetical protein TTHERM_00705180 [Tetrahymena thermophila SB210]EAR90702.1 hypothetical protein TTHERM_00705180 [Tetrahymena thermophila SB210]|eukprot:XP_001010947.1 hypothetical protein TTHERM_00705180 [Tetrahymena thermophila SB210]
MLNFMLKLFIKNSINQKHNKNQKQILTERKIRVSKTWPQNPDYEILSQLKLIYKNIFQLDKSLSTLNLLLRIQPLDD